MNLMMRGAGRALAILVPLTLVSPEGTARSIDARIEIDGANQSIQDPTEDLYIATSGQGELIVRNQGLVEAAVTYVATGRASTATLAVESPGSVFRTTDHLVVGFQGNGTMSVRDGGQVEVGPVPDVGTVEKGRGFLGHQIGSRGIVDVDGPGSVWRMPSHLYVGWLGDGLLNITNGGRVDSQRGRIARFGGSVGEVNVVGPGSIWQLDPETGNLAVGNGESTRATLNIQSGGLVSAATVLIGRYPGLNGTVVVDGTDSRLWLNGKALRVGQFGEGILHVRNRGTVLSGQASIGTFGGGSGAVTIDGDGSLWQSSSSLSVGAQGVGSLVIRDGGRVESQSGYVGALFGIASEPGGLPEPTPGMGEVVVEGMGSVWENQGPLVIANAQRTIGSLSVFRGGQVHSDVGFVGRGAESTGSVLIDGNGSVWASTSDLYIGGDDRGGVGAGSVVARNEGLVDVQGRVEIWQTGTLEVNGGTVSAADGIVVHGRLAGHGTLDSAVRLIGGHMELGSPTSKMTVLGDFTMGSDSILTLAAALGGPSLDVLGQTRLSGTLQIETAGIPAPSAGTYERIVILHSGDAMSGTFEREPSRHQGMGRFMDVLYGSNDLALEIFHALPGDANGDHRFDHLDILQVLTANTFASQVVADWAEGDWDGNHRFDQRDIIAALRQATYLTGPYAAASPLGVGRWAGTSAIASVPEPGSGGLFTLGICAVALVGIWLPNHRRDS